MAEIKPDSGGEGLRVGIVRSRFNERIGVAMLEACRKRLGELGVSALTVVSVPGALEAPTIRTFAPRITGNEPVAIRTLCRGGDCEVRRDVP